MFLQDTFLGDEVAAREAFERMQGELEDGERFAYLELMRFLHRRHQLDLNGDGSARDSVRMSLGRLQSLRLREVAIDALKNEGVVITAP